MEGYWLTHIEAPKSRGDGISMLRDGELLGGGFEHLWSGTFEEEGAKVSAHIRIIPVVSGPEQDVMVREPPMILSLAGYCTDDYARLEGSAEHKKDLRFTMTMRKCKGSLVPPRLPKKIEPAEK